MASTYPLEIVEAARWSKEHPDVKGDAVAGAVQSQTWDPSVKSLVAFPSVLEKMNEKIDWTQKLGDAFLAQQKEVMQAVQVLREQGQGNRQSQEHQGSDRQGRAGTGRLARAADHHHRVAESGSGLRAVVQPHRGVRRLGLSLLPALPLLPAGLLRAARRSGRSPPAWSSAARSGATATGAATTSTSTSTARTISTATRSTTTATATTPATAPAINSGNRAGNNARRQQQAELVRTTPTHRKGVGYKDSATQQKFDKRRQPAERRGARAVSRPRRTGPRADVARRRWAISATWPATRSVRATRADAQRGISAAVRATRAAAVATWAATAPVLATWAAEARVSSRPAAARHRDRRGRVPDPRVRDRRAPLAAVAARARARPAVAAACRVAVVAADVGVDPEDNHDAYNNTVRY